LSSNYGTENAIDFAQLSDGPVFEPLKSREFSRRFFIDLGRGVAERCRYCA
jgi:hypothetical protein